MERHFTATVYIFHQSKALLHRHPKLNKWLPPGGHVELNETPPDAAKREALEETSLDVHLLADDRFAIDSPGSTTFSRPFHCLLENIPEHKGVPAHQHMDFIYLGRPANLAQLAQIPTEFQWFACEDLASIQDELFDDTRQLLAYLLSPTSGAGVSLLSALSQHQPFSSPDHRRK
jgi:ADP-ribose pyrophosphatase YjhB (NUDIX family)